MSLKMYLVLINVTDFDISIMMLGCSSKLYLKNWVVRSKFIKKIKKKIKYKKNPIFSHKFI